MGDVQVSLRDGLIEIEGNIFNKVRYQVNPCSCGSKNIVLLKDGVSYKRHTGKIKCLSCGSEITAHGQYGETDVELLRRWNRS